MIPGWAIAAIVIVAAGVIGAFGRKGTTSTAGCGAAPLPAVDRPLPGGHNEYDFYLRQALTTQGIPSGDVDRYAVLLKSIIQQESGWNPSARGDWDPDRCFGPYRGRQETMGYCSLGLGQIHRYYNPGVAAAYDLLDPKDAIFAIANLIAGLRMQVGDDIFKIAAAYNGGVGMGLSYPNVPDPIQRYVNNVSAEFNRLAIYLA
jgi:hypothetical protein